MRRDRGTDRHRGARTRRRAAIALGLALATLAGCAATRAAGVPTAREVVVPDTVARPADPADDPQLDAIPTVVTRPDTTLAPQDGASLADLPAVTERLLSRVDGTPAFTSIDVDPGSIWYVVRSVSAPGFTDTWSWYESDDTLERRPDPTPSDDESFSIEGVDLAAPARVAAGIEDRFPGMVVTSASLGYGWGPEDFGLHWSLDASGPGRSVEVIVSPTGDVLAVR